MSEIKSNPTRVSRQFAFLSLILALLTLIYFAPVLVAGDDLGGSDFEQIHYPLLKFVVDSVNDSQIPLWNPHQFLGYSVVGNPQYGLLYPPNWLLVLFGAGQIDHGVAWLVALHVWWMAVGLVVFYKQWDASDFGALMGAVVVAFGGFIGARIYAGHYAVLLTVAWLPWILSGYWYASQRKTIASTMWGGMALGMAILAGHPQVVYIAGWGVGLLWVYRLVGATGRRVRWHITRQLGLLACIGLILGAGSWLPTLDYQDQTVRGQADDSLDFANQHAVPPRQLAALIVPNTFGMPLADVGYWGEPFYEEMTLYVGWLPILLVFLGGFGRGKWFALGLVGFGLIMALGASGGFYILQYYLVPPARGFRAPGRFLMLTSIGLGWILALGITQLQAYHDTTYRRVGLILRRVGLPLMIICIGGAILFDVWRDELAADPDQAAFVAKQLAWGARFLGAGLAALWIWRYSAQLGLGLIGVVAVLNVWWMSQPLLNVEAVELSPVWQQAADVVPVDVYGRIIQLPAPPGIINGPSWTGHYSPQGYDPIAPSGWFALMDATGPYIADPGSATNRLFGVRFVASGQSLENYGFFSAQFFNPLLTNGDYFFYDNPDTLARAYVTQSYEVEPSDAAAIQRIQNGEVDRGDVILLPEKPSCEVSGRAGRATIVDYQPNQVTLMVEANGAGIVVLGDQYDPDWHVTVNDQPADLLRVNTTFRGVCVPDGTSTVTFRYRPRAFYVGAILGAVGWLALTLMRGWAFFCLFGFAK